MMKRLLFFLLLPFMMGCAEKTHSYQATDSRIQVMGRHLDNDGAVKFGASGVSFL